MTATITHKGKSFRVDFSHPLDKVPELVKNIENYDVVIGSRYVQGGSVDQRWPLWRKGLSAWGNLYARTILGLPMRDVKPHSVSNSGPSSSCSR